MTEFRMSPDDFPLSPSGVRVCCIDGICMIPEGKWHGTPGGYSNHKCRCRPCTDAWSEAHYNGGYQTRYMASLIAQGLTVHGTPRKYPYKQHAPRKAGCRPGRPIVPAS